MSSNEFIISIPSDSDGFIKYECPSCKDEFKLLGEEIQGYDEKLFDLYCPFCGEVNQ